MTFEKDRLLTQILSFTREDWHVISKRHSSHLHHFLTQILKNLCECSQAR